MSMAGSTRGKDSEGPSRFLMLLNLRGHGHNTQWAAASRMQRLLSKVTAERYPHLFRVCLGSVLPECSLDVPAQSLTIASLQGARLYW